MFLQCFDFLHITSVPVADFNISRGAGPLAASFSLRARFYSADRVEDHELRIPGHLFIPFQMPGPMRSPPTQLLFVSPLPKQLSYISKACNNLKATIGKTNTVGFLSVALHRVKAATFVILSTLAATRLYLHLSS